MGLVHIFGKKPIIQVLDFLIVHKYWDYSLKDISEATGVSFRTLQRLIPRLVKEGIVVKTRKEGKAELYIINFESPTVKKLDELATVADLEYAEKISHARKRVQVPEFLKYLLPLPTSTAKA